MSSWLESFTDLHFSQVFSVLDAKEIVRKGTDKSWTFDRVYNPVEDNRYVVLGVEFPTFLYCKLFARAVYADTVSQMIEDTVNGFNSTVFAYGQTSSGISRPSNGSLL